MKTGDILTHFFTDSPLPLAQPTRPFHPPPPPLIHHFWNLYKIHYFDILITEEYFPKK